MDSRCRMVSFILASGMTQCSVKRATVYKFGLMVRSMKDFGRVIWLKGMEDSSLLMGMSIKGIGLTIRLTARENISTLKEQHTWEAGTKISKKVTVERNGQMVHTTKVPTLEARNTEKESFSGPTEQNIMVNGKTTRCTAKVNSNGPMVEHMRVTMQTTKSMVKEFTTGQMVDNIREDFIMVNSTAKACIDKPTDKKFTVYGKKERKARFVRITRNF